MRKTRCRECGAPMTETRGPHRYSECGLSNVVIQNVVHRACQECGHREVAIPAQARLHRLLAENIARQPARLAAEEVVFLRKHLGWSGRDFAQRMAVKEETASRWATGDKPMGPQAERLLRLCVLVGDRIDGYLADELANVADKEAPAVQRIDASIDEGVWSVCPA